jgi:hypothetical protein
MPSFTGVHISAGFFLTFVSLFTTILLEPHAEKDEFRMYVFGLLVQALTLFLGIMKYTKQFTDITGDGHDNEYTLIDISVIILTAGTFLAPVIEHIVGKMDKISFHSFLAGCKCIYIGWKVASQKIQPEEEAHKIQVQSAHDACQVIEPLEWCGQDQVNTMQESNSHAHNEGTGGLGPNEAAYLAVPAAALLSTRIYHTETVALASTHGCHSESMEAGECVPHVVHHQSRGPQRSLLVVDDVEDIESEKV